MLILCCFWSNKNLLVKTVFARYYLKLSLPMFLEHFFNLKTSNDNNNPDKAIVMQTKGCSGFVRHVMDVRSIFLMV